MPVKDTIILTVFDRPELVLLNTLVSVRKQDLTDTEVLIIDDASSVDYTDIREVLDDWALPYRWERVSTMEDRPVTYNVDGYNNPAYVNNRAVELALGENVFFLSSDTIIPPNAMDSARIWDLDKTIYSARVIDMDSGVERNGAIKPYPRCWFLGISKALFNRVGGFDEEYLGGLGFEDLDFTGRCVLDTRKLVIDCGTTAFHQTHHAASSLDDGKGAKVSYEYTKKKWGGKPPWHDSGMPLHYVTSMAGDKIIVTPKPSEATMALFTHKAMTA